MPKFLSEPGTGQNQANDKRINKINAENKNDILKKPRCLNFNVA